MENFLYIYYNRDIGKIFYQSVTRHVIELRLTVPAT